MSVRTTESELDRRRVSHRGDGRPHPSLAPRRDGSGLRFWAISWSPWRCVLGRCEMPRDRVVVLAGREDRLRRAGRPLGCDRNERAEGLLQRGAGTWEVDYL